MATAVEIERLQALVERLGPLAGKTRGELIAADDWNTLVSAIVEIGRATVATGQAGVPQHEHPDQVGIGWLDPQLRQIVTGGGLKDPALDSALIKLRRDVSLLDTRLGRVGDDLAATRTRVDVVATNDVTRTATLDRLNRKVLGAADDRGDIADLRSTLRTLQTEVGRAVEVGSLLEVDGEPLDVPGLVQRLGSVEQLRDRLTRPDGSLLDASGLEIRLAELQAALVTQEQLTEAIDEVRSGGGNPRDLDQVLDAARQAGRAEATSAVDTLGTDLRSVLSARLAEIGDEVDARVRRATAAFVDEVLTTTRAELGEGLDSMAARLRESIGADVAAQLRAADEATREALANFDAALGGLVEKTVEGRLANVLGELTARVAAVDERMSGFEGVVKEMSVRVDRLEERIEVNRRDEIGERDSLRKELLSEIGRLERDTGTRIGRDVQDARTQLGLDLQAEVTAARRDLEVSLAEVARQAAATEVQVLGTGLRTDVTGVVRSAVASETTGVRDTVAAELAGLQLQVAGLVTNEVARQTQDIPAIVEKQLATLRPELERIVDVRVGRR
ncbi:V-type ATP synthase subunit I [Cellulomonas palmilytica]|uniref:hypothetical protein n=1 Tax=Cellulomonas palmilytica TaxID=2608402 RepID=UPI001F464318|nr:hypothetical protein [Cellulomonas palmilytica]UJP39270.1 hypothetical protein F1D97_13095 [Cellulomonas palmilytica]